jgi:oxygen-independent coproporphyrinogen-3 oxidase
LLETTQISHIIANIDLENSAEISLEANPEDLSEAHARDLRSTGINRVSLGVQSFDDAVLKALGRKHTAPQALQAVADLLEAGFDRVSVDLIFGVPGESPDAIATHIARLRSLGVGHISAYLLTVEPGTPLQKLIHKGRAQAPDDDKQADAYEAIQKVMAESGYRQYEISSYALPGQESRHNRNYWGKGSYLGLGPAAHSMRFLPAGEIERSKNVASLSDWQNNIGDLRELEILCSAEAFSEALAFGLRDMQKGVKLEGLGQRFGVEPSPVLLSVLDRARDRGLLRKEGNQHYFLTQLGARFSDGIAREILALS